MKLNADSVAGCRVVMHFTVMSRIFRKFYFSVVLTDGSIVPAERNYFTSPANCDFKLYAVMGQF